MKTKSFFSIVAVALLLMAAVPLISSGSEGAAISDDLDEGAYYADYKEDKKIICEATLEDNFAENGVLVVLNRETTLSFKTYTSEDFAETKCSKVTDLTGELSALAKKQYDSKASKSRNTSIMDVTLNNELNINFNSFRTILYIELAEGGKENVLAAVKQLEERDDVLSAEPDYIGSICATPNDPGLGQQWGVTNSSLPNAWNVTTGSSNITVGVLDTGIDGNHPDLTNRINKSLCRDFTSGSMVVVANPTDPHGHGTHVAGIIGAQGNNGIGITGTCWDVRLVSLRVLDATGNGPQSNTVLAINFAAAQGIPVLNLSGRWYNYESALEQAIKNYSGLFVCAAGNENNNNDGSSKAYPASFGLPNLISVGATNQSNAKAVPGDPLWGVQGSNYGATTVDVFAPGTDILSTCPGAQYAYGSGTSQAAPYVAGVAALLMTKHKCSAFALKTIIMNSVDKVPALSGLCVSGGKVNAQNAVNMNLFGGGNGTSGNPYQISTSQHLKDIENFSTSNAYYKVMSNITLSGTWMTSIDPTQSNILYGTLDGNGKAISGLSINSSAGGYFGLFHDTRGTVKNLTISGVNVNINAGGLNVLTCVGAISGFNTGTINGCTVNGSITVSGSSVAVGGLTGLSDDGWIENSTNNAAITSNNTGVISYGTGGIVGCNYGSIIYYCNNNGVITGNDDTGGIAGYSEFATISYCNTNANVNYSWKKIGPYNEAGGIAGAMCEGTIKHCTFTGMVKYTNSSSTSTTLQPKMGQIIGMSLCTTLTSNTGNGSVDKGTLQTVGSHNQALYAAQYGLYGQIV